MMVVVGALQQTRRQDQGSEWRSAGYRRPSQAGAGLRGQSVRHGMRCARTPVGGSLCRLTESSGLWSPSQLSIAFSLFFNPHPRTCFYWFRERRAEGERETWM